MRLDDRVCSGWFAVEQGLRQGCIIPPLLFSIFFAAVINVAYTHFKAGEDIVDALVHLRNKTGAGGRGTNQRRASIGDVALGACFTMTLSESSRKRPSSWGRWWSSWWSWSWSLARRLASSKAKTEIICLRTNEMTESTVISSVQAACQVYNQADEFVYLGGGVNQNADLSIEVNRRIRNAWCSFRKYTLKLYDRASDPLELKIRMLRAEVLDNEPITVYWLASLVG